MKVSSIGLGGPYNPLLRSPVLGQRMFDVLECLRWNSYVPLRLNEFASLIIGRQWRSQVAWFAPAPLAIKAGLAPEVVADLNLQKRPATMKPGEAVVYDFVTELTTSHAVSRETFARAKQVEAGVCAGQSGMAAATSAMILEPGGVPERFNGSVLKTDDGESRP